MDRGAWGDTVHGAAKGSDMTKQLNNNKCLKEGATAKEQKGTKKNREIETRQLRQITSRIEKEEKSSNGKYLFYSNPVPATS